MAENKNAMTLEWGSRTMEFQHIIDDHWIDIAGSDISVANIGGSLNWRAKCSLFPECAATTPQHALNSLYRRMKRHVADMQIIIDLGE